MNPKERAKKTKQIIEAAQTNPQSLAQCINGDQCLDKNTRYCFSPPRRHFCDDCLQGPFCDQCAQSHSKTCNH